MVEAEVDVLVAFSQRSTLEAAMLRQRDWHDKGRAAVMCLKALGSQQQAEQLAQARGELQLDWVDS